jgi:NADP-dependent 3-hydroxy acid dehydrogenase YdfG
VHRLGASSGIGLAITELMSRRGWDVYATARSDAALHTLDHLPNVHAIALDITDRSAIAALAHRLPAELNGVVNNAGIIVNGPVEGLSLDDLTKQLDVNVISQIAVTQAVLPKVGVVQRAGDSVNDRDSEFSGHACRVPPLYQLGRVDAVDVVHRDP